MSDYQPPFRAPLECQTLVLTSSSERDLSQWGSPQEDAERTGSDIPPGTVTGMKAWRTLWL